MLRRRWRVVVGTAGLVTVAALLALSGMPATYTATGTILYDPANATAPGSAAAAATLLDQQNEDAATASQAAVIASEPAARALAGQLDLAALPEFNDRLRPRPWPLSLLPARPQPPDQLVTAVRDRLNVAILPNSRVIDVSFTSLDPALAARAANGAMQLYLDHERQQAYASLTDAQGWIEKNSATLQVSLDDTEAQLARARAAAGVVPGAQASLTTETASRLAASLVQAQADLAMNQARLSSAARGDAAAANAAIAPNLLPLRKEQADLAAHVQALQEQYGPDYPDLVAARSSLAAISAEIGAETGRELDAARADVAADQAEIATLQGALGAARVQSQTEDADSAPVRALEQRAEAGQAMLKDMTLQADQLAQAASLARPDARILSLASPPASPSGLHRGLILAAAAGLGVCLGILLAALVEALDTSFRDGASLRARCGLPCYALLPEVKAPKSVATEAPFSMFAEQLRALQTALALGQPQQSHRVLAITAARPGEGKTTLTIALARALALSGLRVVAVDCDVRQPSFDPVFKLRGVAGLTDLLASGAGLESIIRADTETSLAVIGAGTQAVAALPLFLSPAFGACLSELRQRYDVVLLDVPPAFALGRGPGAGGGGGRGVAMRALGPHAGARRRGGGGAAAGVRRRAGRRGADPGGCGGAWPLGFPGRGNLPAALRRIFSAALGAGQLVSRSSVPKRLSAKRFSRIGPNTPAAISTTANSAK